MLYLIVLTIIFAINRTYAIECQTVKAGHHYSTLLPVGKLKSDLVISTRIQFNYSTAHYLFPPTDDEGHRCQVSWNKLWGATRCGYLTSNHKYSDRFMWRRAISCLLFDTNGHVIGEKTNCSEANLIELVAAAYDNGTRPYEHTGTLLKEFSTRLRIDTWYRFTLTFEEDKTVYQLFDDTDKILETQTINHHSCSEFNYGMMQNFYFGGVCPAPQAVTACYDD